MDSWKCEIASEAGVYIITLESRNKYYIGSAINLRRRRSEHLRSLRRGAHENKHLQRSWSKYGENAFSFRVLLDCDESSVVSHEQSTLDHYSATVGWRRLFNQNRNAASRLGSPHSQETLQKMRDNNSRHFLGKHHTEKTRQKIANLACERWKNPEYRRRSTGRVCADGTREKMRRAATGRVVSDAARDKIRKAMKGRVVSEKTKEKLKNSPRFSGRKHTPETKDKIRKAFKGRLFSEETRRKISVGVKRSKARLATEATNAA